MVTWKPILDRIIVRVFVAVSQVTASKFLAFTSGKVHSYHDRYQGS
jgi:hypothetical protein